MAPTKAFNLAGLQTAAVIVPDPTIRHRVNRGLNTDEVAEPNVFAAIAPAAAFGKGGEMSFGPISLRTAIMRKLLSRKSFPCFMS